MPAPPFRDYQRRRGEKIVKIAPSSLRNFKLAAVVFSIVLFGAGFSTGWYWNSSMEAVPTDAQLPVGSPVAESPAVYPEDLPEGATAVNMPVAIEPAATEASATEGDASSPPRRGHRYAIVVQSIPASEDPVLAEKNASSYLRHLRAIGFKSARAETVEVPEKGRFIRVIAMEAIYPSVTVANNDIAAMRRRGEISSGFPLRLEDGE